MASLKPLRSSYPSDNLFEKKKIPTQRNGFIEPLPPRAIHLIIYQVPRPDIERHTRMLLIFFPLKRQHATKCTVENDCRAEF